MIGLALYNLIQIISEFADRPVDVLTEFERNSDLPFPAVTLCNMNPTRKSKLVEVPLLSDTLSRLKHPTRKRRGILAGDQFIIYSGCCQVHSCANFRKLASCIHISKLKKCWRRRVCLKVEPCGLNEHVFEHTLTCITPEKHCRELCIVVLLVLYRYVKPGCVIVFTLLYIESLSSISINMANISEYCCDSTCIHCECKGGGMGHVNQPNT